jgi:hypothetical protein
MNSCYFRRSFCHYSWLSQEGWLERFCAFCFTVSLRTHTKVGSGCRFAWEVWKSEVCRSWDYYMSVWRKPSLRLPDFCLPWTNQSSEETKENRKRRRDSTLRKVPSPTCHSLLAPSLEEREGRLEDAENLRTPHAQCCWSW